MSLATSHVASRVASFPLLNSYRFDPFDLGAVDLFEVHAHDDQVEDVADLRAAHGVGEESASSSSSSSSSSDSEASSDLGEVDAPNLEVRFSKLLVCVQG